MQAPLLWDLFCTVIDNHGDLGVSVRLSRQLRDAGQRVRLWVDDPSALQWMAPALWAGQEPGIELRRWQGAQEGATLQGLEAADVWIEAFGCHLPEAFVAHGAATRSRPPVWINLEYLSAERWVERHHRLPSPVMVGPARGWIKHFFYPGWTPSTGGLLREPQLLPKQQAFDRADWRARHAPALPSGAKLISLFCYEPAALPQLLEQLQAGEDRLWVTPGRSLAAVEAAQKSRGLHPHWTALPYTDQDGFDEMLWACDLNFVRGEDSLVRALWAGRPLVWQIYPQDDGAHRGKLEAFLEELRAPESLRHYHRLWNGLQTGALPALQDERLEEWGLCVESARQRLGSQDDLLTQLLRHVRSLLP